MIRYGSQVELIVPITDQFELETVQETGVHVEAGVDPLIKIIEKETEADAEEYFMDEIDEIIEEAK